jgi:hypothetical protein
MNSVFLGCDLQTPNIHDNVNVASHQIGPETRFKDDDDPAHCRGRWFAHERGSASTNMRDYPYVCQPECVCVFH